MSKQLKKYVDELKEHNTKELELVDKGLSSIHDVPSICKLKDYLLIILNLDNQCYPYI